MTFPVPDADLMEQTRLVDDFVDVEFPDVWPGEDDMADPEAPEADALDQHRPVPDNEDEYQPA
jgi:hypothetical protein